MVTAIVCADRHFGIGKDGDLLIHIPEDLKRFSRLTANGYMIMGRKTFDSLPGMLKNRYHIVITHSGTENPDNAAKNTPCYVNMETIKEWLLKMRADEEDHKISIIGGAMIFEELKEYCDFFEITKVFKEFDADTYMFDINKDRNWELCGCGDVMEYEEEGIKYQYRKYKNKKPISPSMALKKKKADKKAKKAAKKSVESVEDFQLDIPCNE